MALLHYRTRRVKGSRRAARDRRPGAVALALLAAVVVVAWMAPRVSAAVSGWVAAAPIKGCTLSVALDPAAPADARGGGALSGQTAKPGTGGRLDPGWRFNAVGGVCDGLAAGAALPAVEIRTADDDGVWSVWRPLDLSPAAAESGVPGRVIAEPLWVGTATLLEFRVLSCPEAASLDFSFINSLGDATVSDRVVGVLRGVVGAISGLPSVSVAGAATARPAIVSRAQWGADESWRVGAAQYAPVKMAFVHHTVSGNGYTRAQAAAVVRSIYYYHTHSAGFRDIGYNFLIDRYGTIYEGRYGGVSAGVIGAQTLGFNTGSTGISLVGDFSSATPPAAMMTSLAALLAWKLDVQHIDPLSTVSMYCATSDRFTAGTTVQLPAISAHRDACYTACPGNGVYSRLAAVRTAVAGMGLPKIYAYAVSPTVLSPNGDGVADDAVATFGLSGPADWTVKVANADGVVVRRLTGNGPTVSAIWDGKDDVGACVADGSYTVVGTATTADGSATPGRQTVVVDTTPPTFTSSAVRTPTVNPEGGGAGDRARFSYALNEPCSVQVTVRSSTGQTVRTLQSFGALHQGPRTVSWGGMVSSDGKLVPAPEGTYTIVADAKDVAGNAARSRKKVKVDRTVRVESPQPIYLSPNGDGTQDTAAVAFTLRRTATVSATVTANGATVCTASLGQLAAGGHVYTWDGRRADGTVAPGGPYTIVVRASGAEVDARAACPVVVDSLGPRFTLGARATVKRGVAASMNYVVHDLRSVSAHVDVVISCAGVVVDRLDLGWMKTNATLPFSYTPVSVGLYEVSFGAVDQAGNHQQARAVWSVRAR